MNRSKQALIFLLFGLLGVGNLYAQNPFEISLTGIKTDIYQKGIVALDDGGFVTKEMITNSKNYSYNILISRLDPCLGIKWAKLVTATQYVSNSTRFFLPASSKIIKANDNGFLLVYTDGDPWEDCIVMKLDSAGNRVWSSKIHTGNGNTSVGITSLTCTAVKGHGYAVGGICSGITFMVRLSEDGKAKWSKIYLGGSFRQMSRILTFSDSSFMVLFPGDESQIMRLDTAGKIIWAREDHDINNYQYSDLDINDAIVDNHDFVYANGNFNDKYPGLMKMDKDGKELWEYTYAGANYSTNNCLSIALTKGKKIVLSNTVNFYGGAKTAFIETDTNGHVMSAKTVPDITLNAYQNSIQVSDLILDAMADSGFAFIGTDANDRSLIAKADKYGVIGCNSVNLSVDTASHVSLFSSLTVSAVTGYLISDTPISLKTVKNKATLICSSNYYPFANIGGNQVICSGSSVTLNAGTYNPNFKFLWSTGDTTFSIAANKTGIYWAQISHNSCSSSDTANIIFRDQVKPGLAKKYSICPYDSVLLKASPSSLVNYYWSIPGTISTVNGDTLWAKNAGIYLLKIVETTICPVIDTIQVNHYPLPKSSAGPDTLICHNQAYTMQGSGGIKYKWMPADFLSSDTIPNPIIIIPDSQSYMLAVCDIHNCRDTPKVVIKTRPVLQVVSKASDTFGCYGKNIYLFAKGQGGNNAQYQFSWPDDGLTGDSVPVNIYKSGWHIVELSDNCTPVPAYDSIYVRVVPPAVAAFDFKPQSPVQVKIGRAHV